MAALIKHISEVKLAFSPFNPKAKSSRFFFFFFFLKKKKTYNTPPPPPPLQQIYNLGEKKKNCSFPTSSPTSSEPRTRRSKSSPTSPRASTRRRASASHIVHFFFLFFSLSMLEIS